METAGKAGFFSNVRKGLFLLSYMAGAAIHADLPLTSDNSTPKPIVKKALTPSKEDEQKTRILSLRADLLAKKPELLSSVIKMEHLLRSPQAMENYLRSMLDNENVNDLDKSGQRASPTDVNAQNDTAKVDAEMARLEKSRGGNLGAGTDPTHDPGTYPLENTTTNHPSLPVKDDTGENVVEQADAAFERLKQMIDEKRRILDATNDVNSDAGRLGVNDARNRSSGQQAEPSSSRYTQYVTGAADKAHNDTNVSSRGLADFKVSHPTEDPSEAARKASLLWHLDSKDPVPSNRDADPEQKGRLYQGILDP